LPVSSYAGLISFGMEYPHCSIGLEFAGKTAIGRLLLALLLSLAPLPEEYMLPLLVWD
jgi:hypothetical protein